MKNLQYDILVGRSTQFSSSISAMITSGLIQLLCEGIVDTTPDIVEVLGTRTASNPRGMIKIAGTLAGGSVSPGTTGADLPAVMTRTMLVKYGKMSD